jgi:hypothetical protein
MKTKIVLLLLFIILVVIKLFDFSNSTKLNKTNESTTKDLDVLISTIEFNKKASKEELLTFPDGLVPWVSIADPEKEIDQLIGADSIVIQNNSVILLVTYPLNNPGKFELKSTKGFTRKQLIFEISQKYYEIYNSEEQSATIKTIARQNRKGLVNRNTTNGKYGVWGHDIQDLDLSSIEVYKTFDNKILLRLNIES